MKRFWNVGFLCALLSVLLSFVVCAGMPKKDVVEAPVVKKVAYTHEKRVMKFQVVGSDVLEKKVRYKHQKLSMVFKPWKTKKVVKPAP